MKKIISGLLSLMLAISSVSVANAEETQYLSIITKKGIEYNTDMNFSGTDLIVIIKSEYSAKGKVWEPEFFGLENVTEVKDITYIDNESFDFIHYNQILVLKFAEDNKAQILNSIDKVEELKEVSSAITYTPSSFCDEYVKPEPIVPAMLYVDTDGIKYTIGDIDGNGTVDMTDLSKLSISLLGDNILAGIEKIAADVDGSGFINTADLARLKQFLVFNDEIKLSLPEDKELMVETALIGKLNGNIYSNEKTHEFEYYYRDYTSKPLAFGDVINNYEEFEKYIDYYNPEFSDGILEKYNKEYFTRNTLLIFADINSRDFDLLVYDTTVTDTNILVRTYQRTNGLGVCMQVCRLVTVDIPNELYKNQKISYEDEYTQYAMNP